MTDTLPKILLVDDEQKFLNSLAERLKLLGFNPLKASSGAQALELAQTGRIDLAIVDYKMPGMDGLVTITKLKEIYPDVKTVLLTGHGSEKVKQATEALNAAYVEKDRMADFWDMIKNSSQKSNIIFINPSSFKMSEPPSNQRRSDGQKVKDIVPPSVTGPKSTQTGTPVHLRMIGETLAMQELRRNIERVAGLDCPVIIRGETGTGKQLTARMIHDLSPRSQNRFMAVNCGCFSNDLLIEELFRPVNSISTAGVQRTGAGIGSDTGATILLDQIEDLSPKMQLSMLKIIDSKNISSAGGSHNFPLDVRILAASRHKLGKLVAEGKFREELYYRLNVIELYIPPLRERTDDIPPLCGYFLAKFAGEFNKAVEFISEDVIKIFMSYDFPGNVRELEHIIERAVILADGNTIEPKHLPGRFQTSDPSPLSAGRKFTTLAEMEKQYILEVLDATGGNKSKAVELLGISRAALWRKLKQFQQE
ncbi:MAG: sigma-54-dependent Fis family transcriptional regulator [Desulfobacterales bacterium]|nr:MAG: sigma-54-dependent Fis family transcriptional regulator [Desulfobacterales bacterium]